MKITHVTAIELEEEEKGALQTLENAYKQCITDDRIECDDCPLYDKLTDVCIGLLAERIRDKRG